MTSQDIDGLTLYGGQFRKNSPRNDCTRFESASASSISRLNSSGRLAPAPPYALGIFRRTVALAGEQAVALAEIGDKTQLLALILAARFRKPWPIIAGIVVATLANHAAAGAGASLPELFNLLIELAEADSNLVQSLRGQDFKIGRAHV